MRGVCSSPSSVVQHQYAPFLVGKEEEKGTLGLHFPEVTPPEVSCDLPDIMLLGEEKKRDKILLFSSLSLPCCFEGKRRGKGRRAPPPPPLKSRHGSADWKSGENGPCLHYHRLKGRKGPLHFFLPPLPLCGVFNLYYTACQCNRDVKKNFCTAQKIQPCMKN